MGSRGPQPCRPASRNPRGTPALPTRGPPGSTPRKAGQVAEDLSVQVCRVDSTLPGGRGACVAGCPGPVLLSWPWVAGRSRRLHENTCESGSQTCHQPGPCQAHSPQEARREKGLVGEAPPLCPVSLLPSPDPLSTPGCPPREASDTVWGCPCLLSCEGLPPRAHCPAALAL